MPWQDQYMQPEVIVGLMSAGEGALAIAASTFTTYRSLEVQRDNTKATLETQRALADMQERALRDRSQEEELRSQQASLYAYLIRWTYNLLEALDQMTAEHSELPKSLWHIEPVMKPGLGDGPAWRKPARVPAACLPIMLILTRYGLRVAVRPSARPVTVRPALPQPRPGTRRAGPIDRRVPQPLNDLARTR